MRQSTARWWLDRDIFTAYSQAMKNLLKIALPVFAILAFAACGDDTDDDTTTTDDTTQTAAEYTFATVWNPDPPIVGTNTLTVTLTDTLGNPVIGATVVVTSTMPMHGHGTNVEPVVTETSDGVYTATPVAFTMMGAWETLITAEGDAGVDEHKIELTVN